MSKFTFNKEISKLLIRNKTLRSSVMLIVLLLILTIVLLSLGISFSTKIEANAGQIQDAESQLFQLQQIVNEEADAELKKIENRKLAAEDEIVPFISLLENLFAIIDPESEIGLKSKENEIYINRYADYEVQLDDLSKMDLFLKVLDELHESKYLTKIVSFRLNYGVNEESNTNEIRKANLIIRLYFE